VLNQAGYETHFNQPDWREPDPQRWAVGLAKYATGIVQNRQNKGVVLAGFSTGAAVSLQTAELLEQSPEIHVEGVLAASVSPYFGKQWLNRVRTHPTSGVHAMPVSQQRVFREQDLPKITSPVLLFVGTRELDVMREFHENMLYQYPHAVSIKPPCAHNILDESYVEAISQNMRRLQYQR
jgi:pimeloyl-ACP methyl ester carboxylesterase